MNANRFHANIKRLMDAGYNVKVQRGGTGAVLINGRSIDRALVEELYPVQLMSLVADKIGDPSHTAVRR
jgi:hypothetical protein